MIRASVGMKADLPDQEYLIVHTRKMGIRNWRCWYHPTFVRCEKCPDEGAFDHRDNLRGVRDYPDGGGYTAG